MASATTGMCSQKTASQPISSTSKPPSAGPTAIPMEPMAVQMTMAFARSPLGNTSVMIESVDGRAKAAPRPCSPRITMSVVEFSARAAPTAPAPKITIPAASALRLPNRSPMLPPTRRKPARIRLYKFTTHCRTELLASRSRAMAGRAVFTTVPSRKIMKVDSDKNARMTFLRTGPRVGASGFSVVIVVSMSLFPGPPSDGF